MLNIVVPMAGRGSRFADAGYDKPKPLIEIAGKPMIQWVIENIKPNQGHRFIFICQKQHLDDYPSLTFNLNAFSPGCVVLPIEEVTEGAACTVLLAKEYINNDDALMIANSDQYVKCDINTYLSSIEEKAANGLIMTFWADDPKWSFCRSDEASLVTEVVEKEVVSNDATVGIYNFAHGSDFVRAAESMVKKNERVNGEFYVAPVYNELIKEGAKIVTYSIGKNGEAMYGLGVPEDLEYFKESFLVAQK